MNPYRSGFVCIIGRPNTGKSTLTNALVGSKVAITSSRPQTTRHAIRGLVHRQDGQIVLIDTPGLHKPRTLLGQRLNDLVRTTWSEVDAIVLALPADEKIGPGDRLLMKEISGLKKPLIAAVTKTDRASAQQILEHLVTVSAEAEKLGITFSAIVPVSAVKNDQVTNLADEMLAALPEGAPLYPEGHLTDEPEETLVAEIVREAALEGVRDELPHSIAVVVDEIVLREGRSEDKPLLDVRVNIYVERASQKGIMIGARGSRLREIGTTSRQSIERLLGTPVFLDLHVKVAKEWQRDPKQLRKLGF